ncbi:Rossmann-like and DUF2520 domain-containing protein [Alkalibacter saccharofermentans]|uniref:Predicted oxidoreductase, contains short-chain dehydrogenase (SDR) and DUF2520 domains n=1 Tax=Alkalibacter saccharofermentans DSM 14828 TaxID=1120975 RepID=A0A1M4Y1G5_9FIRM|nr:DUF2520 domain-containing protein [Alkalibacter saccharofermentans]SHE99529.1 Predicted oxidoreductase, contains short-chain dehydrogenase (SDR) and DUF2520 domains [Alkalibacter saccharofermentans DSM 14828]
MKIGFIGAGNAGVSLGRFFKEKGLLISGFYSRSYDSSQFGAKETSSAVFDSLDEAAAESDIIIVSVPDDAIIDIAAKLVKTGEITKDHLLIHLSGTLDSGVFSEFEKIGCGCYSLHPVMTFPNPLVSSSAIKNGWFTYEGNGKNPNLLDAMLESAGINSRMIKRSDKILYHAGACILSNYLVTLLNSGFDVLKAIGWEDEDSKEVFIPLVEATLENFKEKGSSALSGPVARGDMSTIEKHITALEPLDDNLLDLYKTLGKVTAIMAEKSSSDKDTEKMLEIFEKDNGR